MYNGVLAYTQAMRDACVRPNGPCGYAKAIWKSVSAELDRIEPAKEAWRDGTY